MSSRLSERTAELQASPGSFGLLLLMVVSNLLQTLFDHVLVRHLELDSCLFYNESVYRVDSPFRVLLLKQIRHWVYEFR